MNVATTGCVRIVAHARVADLRAAAADGRGGARSAAGRPNRRRTAIGPASATSTQASVTVGTPNGMPTVSTAISRTTTQATPATNARPRPRAMAPADRSTTPPASRTGTPAAVNGRFAPIGPRTARISSGVRARNGARG